MKKKILIFVLSLICMLSLPIVSQAEDYGEVYPSYIPYSGGAYIEVQSAVGRGTLVFQNTYKTGYFGFYGDSYNICNLSNSSITGRFITTSGKEYNARVSSFNIAQYYYEQGTVREWRDLNTTKIYNTNCYFTDKTELKRANLIDIFDEDPFKYTIAGLGFLIFLAIISILIGVLKRAY